jgi:hypothetical protein
MMATERWHPIEEPHSKFYLIELYMGVNFRNYPTLSSIVHTFYIENDAEILGVHYTWKVAEKGFKMAFMMNKLAMINSC